MTRSNLFGPLVNLHHVSRAIRDHTKTWIDTYLNDIERDNSLPARYFARPASYLMVNLLSGMPGAEDSPAIVIVTRGANGRPAKQGDSYDLPLDIGMAVVTASFEADGAREAAGAYAAAIAGLMLQRPNLGGVLDGSLRVASWDDVRMDDLTAEEQRSRAILRLEFTVNAKDIIRSGSYGPATPDPPPDPTADPGPFPTVAETLVTLNSEDVL